MVTATESKTETSLRQLIIEWVDEQLGMGDDHADAFEVTAERIVREGYSDAFVKEFATNAVREVYQSRVRHQRRSALEGKRRVDIGQLQADESLLDTMWYVDDHAVRLGDFNTSICQKAKGEFASKARGLIHDVNFLDRIQQNLKPSQTVRSVFTDDQLRSIWEATKVMD